MVQGRAGGKSWSECHVVFCQLTPVSPSYREICQILQPDGVHLRLYNDIYMLDVMEYDESGDEEVVIRDCPVSAFQEQRAYEYRQLVGGGESGERGLAIF